eukprot:268334-Chlamydomonas_euryale.AAC.1
MSGQLLSASSSAGDAAGPARHRCGTAYRHAYFVTSMVQGPGSSESTCFAMPSMWSPSTRCPTVVSTAKLGLAVRSTSQSWMA